MKLRNYQLAGVTRLLAGSCILADEMGLGKTVTALTAAFEAKVSQVTVICPVAAIPVWKEHIDKVGGKSQFCTVTIVPFSRLGQEPAKGGILIVDEAHYVKNRQAARTKHIKRLAKGYKIVWLLTGTPAVNHAADYWSLLSICYPKDFSSYWRYVDIWCSYEWSPFGGAHKKILPPAKDPVRFAQMLSRYVLRRTKDQVGVELPTVTEVTLRIPMTPVQERHHTQALKEIILELSGKNWFISNAAVAYMRARQIAIDARILGATVTGNKLPVLQGLLEEAGSRVIVFSEFVDALKLAHKESPGWLYHGGLSESQRLACLVNWKQDPLMRPLYMSRAVGGVALTLTEAHTCVFLDEPWNSTDREQAIARMHRIGQVHPVTVYSLQSIDSVEEHVIALQSGKREALAAVHKHLLKQA